jgi:hypothetical protein
MGLSAIMQSRMRQSVMMRSAVMSVGVGDRTQCSHHAVQNTRVSNSSVVMSSDE